MLIYPANGYAALQVYSCLKDNLRYYPIMGNHGHDYFEYVCDEYYSDLPLITEMSFVDQMNIFCKEHNIKYIIPTHDSVVVALKMYEEQIGVRVLSSDYETCVLCRYKSKTYERLADCDFVPRTFDFDGNYEFPMFAKDDQGQGGKGSKLVLSERDVQELKNCAIDYILCEYLPGDEITIDCFTNRHGELLYCKARSRETIMNGISKRAHFVQLTNEIRNIAERISERITFRGYWYFQCKKDVNGKYKLLEISTRFAGTFCLSKGLDDPLKKSL